MSPEMEIESSRQSIVNSRQEEKLQTSKTEDYGLKTNNFVQKEDPNKMAFSKIAEELRDRSKKNEIRNTNEDKKEIKSEERSSNVEAISLNNNQNEGGKINPQTSNFKIPDSRNIDEKPRADFRTSPDKNNGPVKMSLNDLRPAHDKAKIPTKENLGSLKDALAGVLSKPKLEDRSSNLDGGNDGKEVRDKNNEINSENGNTKKEIRNKDNTEESNKSNQDSSFKIQASTPREVPEDVLRKLLQVEEPKVEDRS